MGNRGRPPLYSDEQKQAYIAYALSLMKEDYTLSSSEAAGMAGRDAVEGQVAPAGAVQRFSREAGVMLSRVGGEQQRRKGEIFARYTRRKREDQRARLLALIDLEMARTEKSLRSREAQGKEGLAVNFSQRLQALATAHGTIASHSRSDELHALRMGDIDPEKPSESLEDWDGNPDRMPADLETKVIDIARTRRLSRELRAAEAAD